MNDYYTIPGKLYAVTSESGCKITLPNGKLVKECSSPQDYFIAPEGKVFYSDEAAVITETFNLAPQQRLALLGVLGGDKLPAGYTRLEYLESTGTQNILIPYTITYSTGIYLKGQLSSAVTETGIKYPFSKAKSNFPNTGLSLYAPAWRNSNSWLYEWGRYAGDSNVLSGVDYSLFEAWNNWDSLRFVKAINCRSSMIYSRTNSDAWFWGAENENNFEATAQDFNLFNNSKFRIYCASIRQDFNEVTRNFIPALDPAGVPCMFDEVSRKPFRNAGTGAFIAGLETQKQLDAMLRKLPNRTGQDVGTLQVRLADELQTPENEAKLEAMLVKNWEISQAA